MKMFTRHSMPGRERDFLQEVAFLEQCKHPSIMRVFDKGLHHDKHPFVVAEYLPKTLDQVIRGRTTTVERISMIVQLLSAINYLADLNPAVVHRDIKPPNVLIKDPSCVLGDFG